MNRINTYPRIGIERHLTCDQAACQADLGLLLLRLAAGGFLLPHGFGKLFGWFGGPGIAGFAAELQVFGLSGFATAPLPFLLALAQSGLGVLVLVGAWSRVSAWAAAAFLATTFAATVTASQTWFWMHHGGEYPLFWTLAMSALALTGPGRYSVDHWRSFR
jgi:putative oxidoreductase